MDTSQSNDFVRTLFLHGSAYKILSLQILEYQDSKKGEGQKLLLKKRDQELVRQAADLIDNDILNFKTVKKLGENVGLNNTKLQNGFKMFYGLTVNEYVQQRRLDLAKNLIRNTDFSFSEIAYMVGLSSKSYFSKIFKDRYGITPSEIRNGKTN
jgi:AraC-like DNA-binding protein